MELTADLLKKAITGEFNAILRYKKFAEIANQEGFKNTTYLFRTLVIAEHIHIKNHKKALGESYDPETKSFQSGKTLENVNSGIEGETWEFKTMYPGFIKQIEKADKSEMGELASLSMTWAKNVEYTHAALLKIALAALQTGKDLDIDEMYICKICGNIVFNKPQDTCVVCGHDKLFFFLAKREEGSTEKKS